MTEKLQEPTIDEIQTERLGGLILRHDDIDKVAAMRAAEIDVGETDEIDGVSFRPPESEMSSNVEETEAAINKAVRGKPWQQ